jgi:hypothetical protein
MDVGTMISVFVTSVCDLFRSDSLGEGIINELVLFTEARQANRSSWPSAVGTKKEDGEWNWQDWQRGHTHPYTSTPVEIRDTS